MARRAIHVPASRAESEGVPKSAKHKQEPPIPPQGRGDTVLVTEEIAVTWDVTYLLKSLKATDLPPFLIQ
jgi:hypothetical protein